MTKDQQLLRIKNEWRAAHNGEVASARIMLEWAQENNLWQLDVNKAWAKAVAEFSDALGGEMTTDSEGNEIHVNLAFRDPQLNLWLWDQRDTINPERAQLRATQHWKMAYSDIRADVLTINDYHQQFPERPRLQYSLDFAGALLDDGIIVPSSIAPELPIAPPLTVPADSAEPPEPSRPSFPRVRPRRPREGAYLADVPPSPARP